MSDDREHMTSSDIFGDVLAEVEEEARRASERRRPAKPSLPTEDIERRLEETLSGVLPVVGKTQKRAGAPAEKRPGKPPDLPTESEIDALLDETLSSLDIPIQTRKATASKTAAARDAVEERVSDARPAALEATPKPESVLDLAGEPAGDLFRTQAMPTFAVAEDNDGQPFGDYTLLDRVAVGGMAEVWRARRRGVEGFQKTVAIKKILSHLTGSPDFVAMLIDEAKLAAQLDHNNIIQIFDLGKVGDDFFIAMEYVDGKDLRTILNTAAQTARPVPLALGLLILDAVARALDYAHRKRDFDDRALGLVHRDVSPQNVLISFEGEIKLCDFGIVKAVAKASTTQMGALKGKLQYMSPEQAWGKPVDARSDIFSLGSVAYEILTGEKLFSGDSEIGVLDAVRECRIRSPRELDPTIPEAVERIVCRALAKAPEDRYQTAGDLEHDVKAVLDGLRPTPSSKDLKRYMHRLFAVTVPETQPLPEDVVRLAKAAMTGAVAVDGNDRQTAEPEAAPEAPQPVPAAPPEPAAPGAPQPVPAAPEAPQPVAAPPLPEESFLGLEADRQPETRRPADVFVPAAPVFVPPAPAVETPPPENAATMAPPEDVAPEAPPPATPLETPQPAEPDAPASARRGITWLLAAVLIGLLIGAGVYLWRTREADRAAGAAAPPVEDRIAPPPASVEPVEPPVAAGPAAETAAETGAPVDETPAEPPAAAEPAPLDIEQMVEQELSDRAERLRRDFEAERQRIEEELAKTRQAAPQPSTPEGGDGPEDDGPRRR